jgi:hypothetical protein
MQIYEYQLARNSRKHALPSDISGNSGSPSIIQLTNHRLNAFEASYSPDGDRIAYILQQGEENRLAILHRKDFFGQQIPRYRWAPDQKLAEKLQRPVVGDTLRSASRNWSTNDYSAGLGWLKPRTVLPSIDTETDEIGLQLYSTTALQQQNYQADVSYGLESFWYDLTYANTNLFPAFEVGITREPRLFSSGNYLSHLEHQRYELAFPLPFTLKQNVFNSSLSLRPSLNYHLYRAYNTEYTPVTPFSRYITAHFQTQFNYRLQQNIRDVQPNSGIQLLAETRHDVAEWNAGRLRSGVRLGAYTFLSPLRRLNQSLRIGTEFIFQSIPQLFNTRELGISGFRPGLLTRSDDVFQISSRYTIPLWHPDDGGFFIPLYLSRIYLVGFSRTVGEVPLDKISDTRSVYGGGIRATFRLSNLTIDLGVALSVEPTRGEYQGFIGTF